MKDPKDLIARMPKGCYLTYDLMNRLLEERSETGKFVRPTRVKEIVAELEGE